MSIQSTVNRSWTLSKHTSLKGDDRGPLAKFANVGSGARCWHWTPYGQLKNIGSTNCDQQSPPDTVLRTRRRDLVSTNDDITGPPLTRRETT